MRIAGWVLRGIIFLALVILAMKNNHTIVVHSYLDTSWRLPLSLLALIFLVVGAVLGMLAALGVVTQQRVRLNRLRAEFTRLQNQSK